MQKVLRWPSGVFGRIFGNSSVQCTSCQKWVYKKCGGIKGSMSKVMKSFVCRRYVNLVTSTGCTRVPVQIWSLWISFVIVRDERINS